MIAALVPAKALDRAKGRLAVLLSEEERRRLALAMLEDVLRALLAVPRLDTVAVVSPDAEVLALATALGATAVPEGPSVRGINGALSHALETLGLSSSDTLLVVLGDVPAATPQEIQTLLDALPAGAGPAIALCPSRARGTGALALRPPRAIPFRFGRLSSLAHRREASARGIPARILHLPGLAADIDGLNDLADLIMCPADTVTHRFLTEIGLRQRLPTGAADAAR